MLVACHDCDLLHHLGVIAEGATARCRRCGGLLRRRRRNGIERTVALALAAAVLFAVANAFPFLSFDMKGQVTQTTLVTGVLDLWRQDMPEIAALVLATSVLAPLLQISLLLYVLLPVHAGRVPWQMARAFRLLRHVQPWSMMEVFLVGILVAVTKLAGMAEVVPGLSLWAFALLIVVLAGAMSSLDPQEVWERLGVRS
ncbi:MAG: paraquat-inducible protein A [Deltaproteobacteria bacterium]|nr:paraquat-inducible protein A [Deltaproteobacteria bacterium]